MARSGKKQAKKVDEININLETTPILYTDNINMTANGDGVVLNVMQRLGPTNKMRIVARIGMSRVHAKKFLEKFGKLLLVTEGKEATGKQVLN
jgi:hypothetical protein